jgi:putative zinc finger protein
MNEKTARERMVSYIAGTCSIAERKDFESHCLTCGECRLVLAVILRAKYLPIDEEEAKVLERLYPLGVKAAKVALDSVNQLPEYIEMSAYG